MSLELKVRVYRVAPWRRWLYVTSFVIVVASWGLAFLLSGFWQVFFIIGIIAAAMLMLIAIMPFGTDAFPRGTSAPKGLSILLWLLATLALLLIAVLLTQNFADPVNRSLLFPAYLLAIVGHILARYFYEGATGWRAVIRASRLLPTLPAEYEFKTKAKIDLESLNAH